jgi:hypothetical protein
VFTTPHVEDGKDEFAGEREAGKGDGSHDYARQRRMMAWPYQKTTLRKGHHPDRMMAFLILKSAPASETKKGRFWRWLTARVVENHRSRDRCMTLGLSMMLVALDLSQIFRDVVATTSYRLLSLHWPIWLTEEGWTLMPPLATAPGC